jgi:hypothetical protein
MRNVSARLGEGDLTCPLASTRLSARFGRAVRRDLPLPHIANQFAVRRAADRMVLVTTAALFATAVGAVMLFFVLSGYVLTLSIEPQR